MSRPLNCGKCNKPKTQCKCGRPTKLTKETIAKLEQAFAYGCSDLEACLYADISHTALYNYQNKNPEFVERKERLKETPVLKARESVIRSHKTDPRLAWEYLKHRKSNEFSTSSSLKHEGEITIGALLAGMDEPRTDKET
jgi:hypothetical protein